MILIVSVILPGTVACAPPRAPRTTPPVAIPAPPDSDNRRHRSSRLASFVVMQAWRPKNRKGSEIPGRDDLPDKDCWRTRYVL
jgi:hypothetical protein